MKRLQAFFGLPPRAMVRTVCRHSCYGDAGPPKKNRKGVHRDKFLIACPKLEFSTLEGVTPVGSSTQISELPALIAAARAGDRIALEKLTEGCRPFLLKIANDELDSGLRVKAAASDLVQETLLEGQEAFARFLGNSEAELLNWLRRILRNNLIDQARKYREAAERDIRREKQLDGEKSVSFHKTLEAGEKTPLEGLVELEKQATLEMCLKRLPEEYRRVIEMRHIEGMAFAQIGATLNKSADAARKVWFRALARLRTEMNAHGEFGSSQ